MNNRIKRFKNIVLAIIIVIIIICLRMFSYSFFEKIEGYKISIPNFSTEYKEDFNYLIEILDRLEIQHPTQMLYYIEDDGSLCIPYRNEELDYTEYIDLNLTKKEKKVIKKIKYSQNCYTRYNWGFRYILKKKFGYRICLDDFSFYDVVYIRNDDKENLKKFKKEELVWTTDTIVKLAPHWYQLYRPEKFEKIEL